MDKSASCFLSVTHTTILFLLESKNVYPEWKFDVPLNGTETNLRKGQKMYRDCKTNRFPI